MDQYSAEWHTWHDARLSDLARPFGWLSITGLTWLCPGEDTTWEGAPGVFRLEERPGAGRRSHPETWVTLELAPGVSAGPAPAALDAMSHPTDDVEVDSADGVMSVRIGEGADLLWVLVDTVQYEVLNRGGHVAIRRHDSTSPLLAGFLDVPTFPLSPDWIVAGRFTAFEAPVTRRIDTAACGLDLDARFTGTVTFTLGGREYSLYVGGDPAKGLDLTFHDGTNGESTAAWRRLSLGVPDAEGRVFLDFNRAVNYPFAFTPYATCPAPVEDNRVDLLVEAGERRPLQTMTTEGVTTPVLLVETEDDLEIDTLLAVWDTQGLDLTRVDLPGMAGVPAVSAFDAIVLVGDADRDSHDRPADAGLEPELVDALAARRPVVAIGTAAPVLLAAAKVAAEDSVSAAETGLIPVVGEDATPGDPTGDVRLPQGVIVVTEDLGELGGVKDFVSRAVGTGVVAIEGIDLHQEQPREAAPEERAPWLTLASRFAKFLRTT
ncbi:DUF1684 domain-containing protein [Brevibacterium litoralis]|uniref:DUF1684 domain-containing protein n=1 Tax=Brevibacterium litoralis TaxID=3138935 RepID=UPI0032EC5271